MFSALHDQGAVSTLKAFESAATSAHETTERDSVQLQRMLQVVASLTTEIDNLATVVQNRHEEVESTTMELARTRRLVESKEAELTHMKAASQALVAPREAIAESTSGVRARTESLLDDLVRQFTERTFPSVNRAMHDHDPLVLQAAVANKMSQLAASRERCAAIQAQIDHLVASARVCPSTTAVALTLPVPLPVSTPGQLDVVQSLRQELMTLRDDHARAKLEAAASVQEAAAERERLRRHIRTLSKMIDTVAQEHDDAARRYQDCLEGLSAKAQSCGRCGADIAAALSESHDA